MMPQDIIEKFDELYSRWSIMDKAGKEMQLGNMMQNAQALYQVLMQTYGRKGYLTQAEANHIGQINQFYKYLQDQKMQVDHDLWNEMIGHLTKMVVKRQNSSY